MKKWIAGKLFDLAVRLDWYGAVNGAKIILLVDEQLNKLLAPKKMGRPKGAKDRVAGRVATPPKKIGRPLGSKNKPKVQP